MAKNFGRTVLGKNGSLSNMMGAIIASGVPQKSNMGPTLCTILYNGVLRVGQVGGIKLVALAGDLTVVTTAKMKTPLVTSTNRPLQETDNRQLHDSTRTGTSTCQDGTSVINW